MLARRFSLQPDLHVVMRGVDGPDVLVDKCGRIDVADDEVETAVVVEVRVRGAVRESGTLNPPLSGHVSESQVAGVAEDIIRDVIRVELVQNIESCATRAVPVAATQ